MHCIIIILFKQNGIEKIKLNYFVEIPKIICNNTTQGNILVQTNEYTEINTIGVAMWQQQQ